MKIFAALEHVKFAAKLFAAAGFSTFEAAFAAKDENALKTHIEKAVAAAPAKKVEPSEDELQALLSAELRETLKLDARADLTLELAAISAARSQLSALNAQLSAAGVKFEKPEGFAAALEARISMRAGEELAKHGLKTFPANSPEIDPSKPGNGAAAATMAMAEWRALAPHARQEFFRKGGKLTD